MVRLRAEGFTHTKELGPGLDLNQLPLHAAYVGDQIDNGQRVCADLEVAVFAARTGFE